MGKFELDLFKLQLIYHHFLFRSVIIKLLLASVAVTALHFLASLRDIDSLDSCDGVSIPSGASLTPSNLDAVILDLMKRRFLSPGDRSLCVGRESGKAAAAAIRRLGVLSAAGITEDCGVLPFREASLDFVFSAGAGAPARVVLEMERVLRHGRAGAVMVRQARAGAVVRAATPVATLLRVSDVVAVRTVNGSVPMAMVVFRKRVGPK